MLLFLLFVVWVIIAAGIHFALKRYFLASFLAAGAMVLATQVAGYLQTGGLDPVWLLSSVVGFSMAMVVALLVGLPFRVLRQLRNDGLSESGPVD
jgi:hypothetical protein